MQESRKNIIRPSQLVLFGDQLLVMLGLLSAILASYRIIQINEFPIHALFYRLLIHVAFGVFAWVSFGIYKLLIVKHFLLQQLVLSETFLFLFFL